jgi:hypothetical protein
MGPQFKWLALLLLLPIYILLAWIFNRLALTGVVMEVAQIGSLLLIFFLANYWIGSNETAFLAEESAPQTGKPGSSAIESRKKTPVLLLYFIRSLLAALIVLAATALMAFIGRNLLGEGVIALLYLLPIGWATVRWGRVAGASAALSSALCFDFVFIPPFFTFRIGNLEGWLLLVLFMLTSLVIVGRTVSMFNEVKRREKENNFLYELVLLMANLQNREEIAEFIVTQLAGHYRAGFVKIVLYERGRQPSILKVRGGNAPRLADGQLERSLPIYSDLDLIGKISIAQAEIPLPGDDDPLLQSICRLVALAVDRAQIEVHAAAAGSSMPQNSHVA